MFSKFFIDRPIFASVLSIVATLAGAVLYGARWFDRGDAFEVYSDVVGRLAPLARRPDGTLVRQHPLDGIAGLGHIILTVAFVLFFLALRRPVVAAVQARVVKTD